MAESEVVQDQLQQAVARLEALAARADEIKGKRQSADAELAELRQLRHRDLEDHNRAKLRLNELETELQRLSQENRRLRETNSAAVARLDKAIEQLRGLVGA